MNSKKLLIIAGLIITAARLQAQGTDTRFAGRSSVVYKEKIASLEKYVVPKNYADKSAQAWYDEILTDRNKSLLYAFKNDDVIYDSLLLAKCNAIVKKIASANRDHNFDSIQLYINRSIIANAANYGEGTVMINLGLFLWIDNDDELAMVLAHELAHQLLKHSDSKISKSISMLTADDFKEELKKIKRSEYGKLERFRNLMKGLNIETGKHSRYKESEADSLGVILARNAGFDIMSGARILLKLDNVEDIFTSDKIYVLKDLFAKAPVNMAYFNVKPKYNGLSGMNVTMNADHDRDSVKTHPDCIKRYGQITGNKAGTITITCCTDLSSAYTVYKERAMLEIVRYLYENSSLGLCAHFCFFALQNNYNPAFYNYFLSLCFSRLYYRDKHLERFNSANAGAARGSNLKQLQDLLFALNTSELAGLSAYFLDHKTGDNSEDREFASLMYDTEVKMKDTATAYNEFNKKFPGNKYQYLIQKK